MDQVKRAAAAAVVVKILDKTFGPNTYTLATRLRDKLAEVLGEAPRRNVAASLVQAIRAEIGYGGITSEGMDTIQTVDDIIRYMETL